MKFEIKEIEKFNEIGIPIDNRIYSTKEVFFLNSFVKCSSDLHFKMHFFVYGPPTSIRWATQEQRKMWPSEIKKEDIVDCPICKGKLEIKNDGKYEYYKCLSEKCDYLSYIINREFHKYLILNGCDLKKI